MTRTEFEIIATALGPVVREYVTEILAEVVTRITVVDTQLAGLITTTTEIGMMRERLAVVETRPPQPGPPGPEGAPGPPGKDGASVEYCGTFVPDRVYTVGQLVTLDGSIWHCNNDATTTRPGDGTRAWTLACKRGKDGKA
jgi:hypothetical protein